MTSHREFMIYNDFTQIVYSQIGWWTVDSAKNDEKERIMRYEQVTKNTTKPMRLIEVRERKRF
jgi:hypothetical protein